MDEVESTEITDSGNVLKREVFELCAGLGLEMKQKKNSEVEWLHQKYKDVVLENIALKEEITALKKKCDELEKRTPLLENGDVLSTETARKHWMHDVSLEQGSLSGSETVYGSPGRKQLQCGEGSPKKKVPSSTPSSTKCVTDISDIDGEHELTMPNICTVEKQFNKIVPTDPLGGNSNIEVCTSINMIEEAFLDHSDNEDIVGVKGSSELKATRKRRRRRRRACNIVNSDSENDDVLVSEPKIDTQPELVTDIQSNVSPLHATVSESNVHKVAAKRRLVTLGDAVSTLKRKGETNIVNSDTGSDDDDDDDVPINKLVKNIVSVPAVASQNRVAESLTRRRLASLRKFEENWLQKSSTNTGSTVNIVGKNNPPGLSRKYDNEEDSAEDNESDSEAGSLEEFIVDDDSENSGCEDSSMKSDSDNSLSKNCNHDEASSDSENKSGDDLNYKELISKFRSNRTNQASKWVFEADMLADFGKDPELCMKAVCAVNRQQTIEEQSAKGTLYSNKRGFSHCDAYRGTSLAEFLTGGHPAGELRKSVDELKQYSSKGIELCRELANRYSKQLFSIYKNKEDPFFLPNKVQD